MYVNKIWCIFGFFMYVLIQRDGQGAKMKDHDHRRSRRRGRMRTMRHTHTHTHTTRQEGNIYRKNEGGQQETMKQQKSTHTKTSVCKIPPLLSCAWPFLENSKNKIDDRKNADGRGSKKENVMATEWATTHIRAHTHAKDSQKGEKHLGRGKEWCIDIKICLVATSPFFSVFSSTLFVSLLSVCVCVWFFWSYPSFSLSLSSPSSSLCLFFCLCVCVRVCICMCTLYFSFPSRSLYAYSKKTIYFASRGCVCVCVCVSICVYLCMTMYLPTLIRPSRCICVCMHVCMCVYLLPNLLLDLLTHLRHTHTHTRILLHCVYRQVSKSPPELFQVCVCVCACVCITNERLCLWGEGG